jgi:hypothetical protein
MNFQIGTLPDSKFPKLSAEPPRFRNAGGWTTKSLMRHWSSVGRLDNVLPLIDREETGRGKLVVISKAGPSSNADVSALSVADLK